MERLFVFADFNWLGKAELVGELCYEKLRGSDSYAFKFDENWLKVHAGIISFRKTSTITQACNIPSQEVIFSDVFLMLCQIGVDVFNFLSFFIFLFENQYLMLFLFSFKL